MSNPASKVTEQKRGDRTPAKFSLSNTDLAQDKRKSARESAEDSLSNTSLEQDHDFIEKDEEITGDENPGDDSGQDSLKDDHADNAGKAQSSGKPEKKKKN